ncbi:hypothetical protein QNO08_14650 [Arthrobacter sp. zg-Y820]|uniref:hypothetical protein n=1 Tax=unclassified Arthrobacter TaxID=235627 RepID=UPI001E369993|nr:MULTISPECIES: hypothetical protein [unclassified Arthrobacter]MCC9195652.1 hypothetical protein [Arthrobacter sp. zg-Y820]MDK1278511.1 hypothetical protein [Arthrobacter sp. zg.Y820]WIB09053.1 hypothetical protein QNO08_14650 [Arthrobacter sp. zg-Y820]
MMNLLVAAFMWLLVLTLSLRARSRPDNTMLKAAVVIAASLTTNIDGVYLWAAERWPWPNALDLASNVLLIVGVYYLSRAIIAGARTRDADWNRGGLRASGAALVTITVMIVSFAFIDNPEPSTKFMLDYGDQPAAGLYSAIQYLYIFAVMSATLVTCVRNVPQMRRKRFRVGFRMIGWGCGVCLLLCLSVIVMDVTHVAGQEGIMRGVGAVYDVLYPLTVVLLSAGLAVPPLGRILSDARIRRQIGAVEPQVTALWLATVAKTPAVSLVGTTAPTLNAGPQNTREATDSLHRLVIEIHDWINVNGDSAAGLSPAALAALKQAEALCLRQRKAL